MPQRASLAPMFRVLLVTAVTACSGASAAELRVLAPNAVKEAVARAVAAYEMTGGHKVVVTWSGTEAITRRIGEGEVADVVVNAAQNIDRLSADGKLLPGTRTDFARSAIGVAVAASVPRPDVATVDGLKAALRAARSIVISSGTSGRYLADLFERLEVGAQIRDRLRQPPSGAQIGEFLAKGEAELGFQQVSELIHVPGIQYLGPLPAEVQHYTVYAGAVHARAGDADAARALLAKLRAPETAAVVGKSGMDPL